MEIDARIDAIENGQKVIATHLAQFLNLIAVGYGGGGDAVGGAGEGASEEGGGGGAGGVGQIIPPQRQWLHPSGIDASWQASCYIFILLRKSWKNRKKLLCQNKLAG
jgi:hypothetical protein